MNWNITAGRPVYVQLIEQLELALVAGEFPPGSRIPPVRELAADAGVNPNTMQRALQELEGRGLLQAQRTMPPCVPCAAAAPRLWQRNFCIRCRHLAWRDPKSKHCCAKAHPQHKKRSNQWMQSMRYTASPNAMAAAPR